MLMGKVAAMAEVKLNGKDFDGDTKFTEKFNAIFKSEGNKVKKFPFRSPDLMWRWMKLSQSPLVLPELGCKALLSNS